MAAIKVVVKYIKECKDLEFADASASLGDLREAVEQQISVPKAKQTLICAGRRWQGLAFGDSLKLLEAAGPKGVKEVEGVKVISVMLMAPAGLDHSDDIARWAEQIREAKEIVDKLPASTAEETRKVALLAQDLLVKASTALDSLELIGGQRERRRELLAQVEALEADVDAKKSRI
eukprot:TRINITY_DN38936_c0_g1_i1.p1 TRINITY_DN38936_c0_g1~~TRINITY_DN38936_c0_g1_i1.p1  ORF type:complete len:187 (-),score=55.94 TRINITY_DN38936_c0_g1_i1:125-652(-)